MSGIKSTVEMVYDARSNKSGMIEIEVLGWTYEPVSKRYLTRVADYLVTVQTMTMPGAPGEDPVTHEYPVKQVIAQKEVPYTVEQIDALFSGLGNAIDITESFSAEMDVLISQALLAVTQQEPIYRVASTGLVSTAEDWVLKTE